MSSVLSVLFAYFIMFTATVQALKSAFTKNLLVAKLQFPYIPSKHVTYDSSRHFSIRKTSLYMSDKINNEGNKEEIDRSTSIKKPVRIRIPKAKAGASTGANKKVTPKSKSIQSNKEKEIDSQSITTNQDETERSVASSKKKRTPVKMTADKERPGWVTLKFGSEADEQRAAMEERLKNAERWVSKRLSDDEAVILNRAMGIEKEVYSAIEQEESGTKSKNKPKKDSRKDLTVQSLRVDPELQEAARLRGFLELNPYICSGCGTPFQSKDMASPGFLPPEKLQEHRYKASLIREKQDAIKILEMAGIEIDSDTAEEVLREANVPAVVIDGVRALGKAMKMQDTSKVRRPGTQQVYSDLDIESDSDDENDDYEDEVDENDYLDGLEISADDLLAAMEGGNDGSNKGATSVTEALKKSIAEAAEKELARVKGEDSSSKLSQLQQSNERVRSVQERLLTGEFVNDIDLEINSARQSGGLLLPTRKEQRAREIRGREGNGLIDETSNRPRKLQAIDSRGAQSQSQGYLDVLTDIEKDGLRGEKTPFIALESVCVCQRCFRLDQYGQVEDSLRPGWSDNALLTPERFEQLLSAIREVQAVVLCIVDVFDLQGSLLKNLKQIAGKNPIVVAANKVDLLPKDANKVRLGDWIYSEVKQYCALISPRTADELRREELQDFGWTRVKDDVGVLRRSNVHLVSCQTGAGMDELMGSLMKMATDGGNKVFVMGAANVGKSSFINRLLATSYEGGSQKSKGKKKPSDVPQATVSSLPGTTLDFLKIRLPNGVTMIDTPGLINRGQLTAKLTPAELRDVIPRKAITAVTLRLEEDRCILMGGLAKIELVSGKSFHCTFFISNEIKLHSTLSSKASDFVEKHIGSLIFPPASAERVAEIGPMISKEYDIHGIGWDKSCNDLVIAGLGWISITGAGSCRVRVTVPEGTVTALRPPLLPFEAKFTTAKFTGGRLLKKSRKPGTGSSSGWRA